MIIEPTIFPEIFVIKPKVFSDRRGWFMETFRLDLLGNAIGFDLKFCQDNLVNSSYGVLRGLHYQKPPFTQSKLVSVVSGEILDIIVDVRNGSPNFGKHISLELSDQNKKQVFIPQGFFGLICRFPLWNEGFEFFCQSCYQVFFRRTYRKSSEKIRTYGLIGRLIYTRTGRQTER